MGLFVLDVWIFVCWFSYAVTVAVTAAVTACLVFVQMPSELVQCITVLFPVIYHDTQVLCLYGICCHDLLSSSDYYA